MPRAKSTGRRLVRTKKNRESKYITKDMENAKRLMKESLERTYTNYTNSGSPDLMGWFLLADIILFFWACIKSKLIAMIGSILFLAVVMWMYKE